MALFGCTDMRNLCQQTRCLVNLFGIGFLYKSITSFARLQSHERFLPCRVAAPLTDAIDRAFHLARTLSYPANELATAKPKSL